MRYWGYASRHKPKAPEQSGFALKSISLDKRASRPLASGRFGECSSTKLERMADGAPPFSFGPQERSGAMRCWCTVSKVRDISPEVRAIAWTQFGAPNALHTAPTGRGIQVTRFPRAALRFSSTPTRKERVSGAPGPGLFSRRPYGTKDSLWPPDRLKWEVPTTDFVHTIALAPKCNRRSFDSPPPN
jgi:hypothetical protein